MIKQAEISETYTDIFGREVSKPVVPEGWYLIDTPFNCNLICDNYKAATLKEAAEQLGVESVRVLAYYDGELCNVEWSNGDYTIRIATNHRKGDLLFTNNAQITF